MTRRAKRAKWAKWVIIINGPGGSGKDSFIKYVASRCRRVGIRTYNFSSIDPVKAIAKMRGWDNVKNKRSRKLLADLKRLWIDFNDGPNRYLSAQVATVKSGIIFLHIREPAEIMKFVKAHPRTITLHLARKVSRIGNASDDGTNNYEYDYRIANDGSLDDLARKAEEFISKIL